MLLGLLMNRNQGVAVIAGAPGGSLVEVAAKTIASLVVAVAIGWGVQLLTRRTFAAFTGETRARAA